MSDRDAVLRDLSEISEYMLAKAGIAGLGDGRKMFDRWYRAAEDARELILEQEPVAPKEMDVTPVRMEYSCGRCGGLVGVESATQGDEQYRHAYCPKCGKKVLWDG